VALLYRRDKAGDLHLVPMLAAGARLSAYEAHPSQDVNGGVGDRPFLATGAFRPPVDHAARSPGRNEIAVHPQTQAVLRNARSRCGSVERGLAEIPPRLVDVALRLDMRRRERV